MSALLPCPLCGSEAHRVEVVDDLTAWIVCKNEDCCAEVSDCDMKGVERWNRRAPVQAQGVAAVHLQEFVEAIANNFNHIDRETDENICRGCSGLIEWDAITQKDIEHHRPECIVLRAQALLAGPQNATPAQVLTDAHGVSLSEREAFEAWAVTDEGGWLSLALKRNPEDGDHTNKGDYADDDVHSQWEAWQARAALAQAQQSEDARDAKRHRHMRAKAIFQDRNGPGLYWYLPRCNRALSDEDRLDAAIDAAIAALTGSGAT